MTSVELCTGCIKLNRIYVYTFVLTPIYNATESKSQPHVPNYKSKCTRGFFEREDFRMVSSTSSFCLLARAFTGVFGVISAIFLIRLWLLSMGRRYGVFGGISSSALLALSSGPLSSFRFLPDGARVAGTSVVEMLGAGTFDPDGTGEFVTTPGSFPCDTMSLNERSGMLTHLRSWFDHAGPLLKGPGRHPCVSWGDRIVDCRDAGWRNIQ